VASKRSWIAPAFALAFLLVTPRAGAEDDLARARALFDEAGELERANQWTQAQDKLRQALRIRETAHLHYALGWALENDDRLVAARVEYEAALGLASPSSRSLPSPSLRSSPDDVGKLAAMRLGELDRATPGIEIRVPSGWARVLVDTQEIPLAHGVASVPVDPGVHVVTVERRGRPDALEGVSVTRGARRVVEIKDDAPPIAHDSRAVPWTLVIGGTTFVAAGAIVFGMSAHDASARDTASQKWCDATACVGGAATRPETPEAIALRREASDAASRGNTKQAVGAALGAVGLVSAGVGVYLLVKQRDERGPRLDAHVGPGAVSADMTLRF
jgi:hypothetical protein